MGYKIFYTNKMKHDVKLLNKQGKDMSKLTAILNLLANEQDLPANNKDHQLTGNLKDLRECHIEPDWLLIYKKNNDELTLIAIGSGSHSYLFDK